MREAADTLAQRFARQARATPERLALIADGQRLTYGELDARAAALADVLRARGVTAGTRVGYCLPNGVALAAAELAAWRLGAVVVDVHPTLRPAEREALFRRAGVRGYFADRRADDPLQPGDFQETGGEARPAPADVACINLTSGTTGEAKGVILTHANLARNADLVTQLMDVRADDVVCLVLPLFFGMNKIALLAHWFAGAAVLLEAGMPTPTPVLAAMRAAGATALYAVPTVFQAILERGDLAAHPQPALRVLRAGAGRMPRELRDRLRAAFPGAALHCTYGLTEVGLVTTLTGEEFDARPESVGRPIAAVTVTIANPDANGRGEIVVAAPHAARGYDGDDAATRQVFQADGVHTGDRGWLDAAGYLHLAGRDKDVIKSAGENVPAAVVEAALRRHPAVADCAVAPLADARLGEAVGAWVVLRAGAAATVVDLAQHCVRELPPIQRPREIRFCAALPRNAIGKVVKHDLR